MPPTYTDEGLQAAGLIRAESPSTGVLLLSQYAEDAYALQLLREGAVGSGYLLKDRVSEPHAFADAVRKVGTGGFVLDPELLETMLGGRPPKATIDQLSSRERDVMSCMAEGRTNGATAEVLNISEEAVDTSVASIFKKLALPPMGDDRRRMFAMLLSLIHI